MPEGDTIFRTATRLREVLQGQRITATACSPRTPDVTPLVDSLVTDVASRGKHLLIHFHNAQILHAHLGMTGSWHIYGEQQSWRKPRRKAWLVVDVPATQIQAVCFTPQVLELLTPTQLRRHPRLSRLGPDVLDDTWPTASVVARWRQRPARPLGETLLDQSALCGIGNEYKSELLFLQRLDPFAPVNAFSDQQLEQLLDTARRWLRRNLDGGPRRTRWAVDGSRRWVYGRLGEPCLKCGTPIRMRRQGAAGRSTYWCPDCQCGTNGS